MERASAGGGSAKVVVAVVLLAVGVRLAVIAASLAISPGSLTELADLHDGREYQAIATALSSAGELRALPESWRRFSPGYPALIRLLGLALPLPVSALAVAIAGAAVATALLYRLGADRWTVALFAAFTPSWLVFSSTAMSEGPFLALALAGLLLWRRDRRAAGALVLGVATLVRPVGALLFLPLWLLAWRRCGRGDRLRQLAGYAALPAAWAGVSYAVWHDPLQLATSYVRKDLAWPLVSLAAHLADPARDPLKLGQVGAVLALAAAAGVALVRRYAAHRDARDLEWTGWLAAHGLFYLALPSSWAFECLPRFFVTCLPPILVGIGPYLPRRAWFLGGVAMGSTALAVYWTARALA